MFTKRGCILGRVRYHWGMDGSTCAQLLQINHQFYAAFASSFSATRQRLQPGVKRILEMLHGKETILDLGCGNGKLWQELSRRGYTGQYAGLDFSVHLLEIARQNVNGDEAGSKAHAPLFLQADLSEPGWHKQVPGSLQPFDYVFAFAVLHHIPGAALRREVLLAIHGLLLPGSKFVHSTWQFVNSDRLRKRVQPWSALGLEPGDLETGDYLLDWRREGRGLRYVHHFEPDELEMLAEACGFRVVETFESDGEGGRLGLYQVWDIM
jgi:tRNA (uracil-5-)-methyltransferase TRM9